MYSNLMQNFGHMTGVTNSVENEKHYFCLAMGTADKIFQDFQHNLMNIWR